MDRKMILLSNTFAGILAAQVITLPRVCTIREVYVGAGAAAQLGFIDFDTAGDWNTVGLFNNRLLFSILGSTTYRFVLGDNGISCKSFALTTSAANSRFTFVVEDQ